MLPNSFIRELVLQREQVPSFAEYPYNIPAVSQLHCLPLHPAVTFFAGENGSGKSTFIEAIAILAGFNPEGGTKNFSTRLRPSESELYRHLQLIRNARREKTGFFCVQKPCLTLPLRLKSKVTMNMDGKVSIYGLMAKPFYGSCKIVSGQWLVCIR